MVKKIRKMFFYYSDKIELQSKIIDLMAEQLTTPIHSKKWVKQYFENKVKEKNPHQSLVGRRLN